jgi:hypothetical protein
VRVVTAVLSGAAVVGTAAAAVAVAGADVAEAGTGTGTTTSDHSGGGSLTGPSGFGPGGSSGGTHAASGGS